MSLFPSKTAISGESYLFKKLLKVFENYPKSKDHTKIFFQENMLNLSKNSESATELQRQPLPSSGPPSSA